MSATAELVEYVVKSRLSDIPSDVRHEAKRALVNIVGCALGGAREPAVDIAIASLGRFAGPPTARVLGRAERYDPLFAALLNGVSSHVHDFDDTTPSNYIHASSPVASALFAYASENKVSGPDFLHAFILGFEVISRIGAATYPAHYAAGWHSTGSIGVFGAGVAIGRLLGLQTEAMTHAVSLSATQSAGLREMFGSMGKAFHPGRSAQSGYMAALLAQNGFTGGKFPLESPRGFAAVQAGTYDLARITDRLGETFELRFNAYKPFPCGIVVHPTIDAAIQLREAHGFVADDVEKVELRVAHLVKDLCNKKVISTGLEGKFSIYHAAALGLGRGQANIPDFTDEAANDPAMRRLRDLTEAVGDDSVSDDAVVITVWLKDGRKVGMKLDQSLGNLARPLSDAQLEAKFRAQSGVIAPAQADAAIAACWGIEEMADLSTLIDHCVPKG